MLDSPLRHGIWLAVRAGARLRLIAWKLRGRRELRRHRRGIAEFEALLAARWKAALDRFDLLLLRARAAGSDFNRRHRPHAAGEADFKFDALAQLHARACRVTSEISALLRTGHADGAHARWRTLHEIAVTMFFLRGRDPAVAEAYILHERARAYSVHEEYQRHHDRLGYPPYTDVELLEARTHRDQLAARYGPEYATSDYGWAAQALGVKRPTFALIEESINMEYWRPWFRMASIGQHAGSRGLGFALGNVSPEKVLLAGPSDAGLADPGIGACISVASPNRCKSPGSVRATA